MKLIMHVPPECSGQIVEYAFGDDGEAAYRRITDRNDGSVQWYRIWWEDVWDALPESGAFVFDPWRREPKMPVAWVPCDEPRED